jgi:hypothetical protein
MYHVYAFRKHISERGRALPRPEGFVVQSIYIWLHWLCEPLRRDSGVTGEPLPIQVEQANRSSIPRLGQARRSEL